MGAESDDVAVEGGVGLEKRLKIMFVLFAVIMIMDEFCQMDVKLFKCHASL